MWCHLCRMDFSDFEAFKTHIIKEHGKSFSKKSSESGESEISDQVNEYVLHRHISEKSSKTCNLHSNAVNESVSKKPKSPSIIKKRVPKKKNNMSSSKRVLPKRRVSAVSYQEDRSECSDSNERDHSKRLFNGESNHDNSQFVPINSIDDPEPVQNSNYINPQPISNNNNDSVFLVNPYVGQGVNNYVMGNQAVHPPIYVISTVVPNSTTSKTIKTFAFCSSNILKWLTKHKELCKNIPYPLPISLFNHVKNVHKAIFDHYCTASVSEETSAVLKVYEELDCMIHKHINSINNTLSTS